MYFFKIFTSTAKRFSFITLIVVVVSFLRPLVASYAEPPEKIYNRALEKLIKDAASSNVTLVESGDKKKQNSKFCTELIDRFKTGKKFQVISPVVVADNYASSKFQQYHLKCKFDENLNEGASGGSQESTPFHGTKNFRGYSLNVDGKNSNEYILLSQRILVTEAGGNSQKGEVFSDGDILGAANLSTCERIDPILDHHFYAGVSWLNTRSHALQSNPMYTSNSGFINYKNSTYFVFVGNAKPASHEHDAMIDVYRLGSEKWDQACQYMTKK